MITLEDLSFQYSAQSGDDFALKNLSFEVREGECIAIQGPTGAGKSTLCLALNGIVPHVYRGKMTGKLVVDGIETQSSNVASLAQFVGVMFQDPETQFVGMTVEDELFFGAGNYGISRELIQERSRWALSLLRLDGYEERDPSTLSGGEKQRVALAAILVMRPKILVLDEPTSELDPLGANEVFWAIRRLREELGITLLFTSHQSEMISEVADRILVLNEGRLIMDGPPKQVYQEYEKLSNIGVRIPQVSQFWSGLVTNGIADPGYIPVTLQDAIDDFRALLIKNPNLSFLSNDSIGNREKAKDRGGENTPPLIIGEQVHFRYPGNTDVLKGIDLTIQPGEYVAVIGQNGAGKSTLVKHFNGLLKPTDGSVSVFGKNTRSVFTSELAHHVSYAFQNPDHQIFRPTVWDEVAFGPQNLGFSKDQVTNSVSNALELIGLTEMKDQYPFNMGKGQRQKLAIASVIAMESEVLIIDEPTTGLDWKTSEEVLGLLRRLNEMGRTVIVITHNMDLVAENVSRTIALHQGRILLQGDTKFVLSQVDELRKTYVEPPQITLFAQAFSKEGFPSEIVTVPDALEAVSSMRESAAGG